MLSSASGSLRIAGTSRSAACAGGSPEMSKVRAASSHKASRPAAAISGGRPGMAETRGIISPSFGNIRESRPQLLRPLPLWERQYHNFS